MPVVPNIWSKKNTTKLFIFQLFIYIILLLSRQTNYARNWIVSDSKVKVRFEDQTTLLKVTDKRYNNVWEQIPFASRIRLIKVDQKVNKLSVSLSGAFIFKVVILLNEASNLELKIYADEKIPIKEFAFPAAFETPDKKPIFARNG